MKCHKPNTDQEAFLQVYANGHPCPEYVHPSASNSDPNTISCFIPVSDDEKITIKGYFNGTALHGSFDLLVDGSYLADKRIENKGAKFTNRKIDFLKAFDVPVEDGRPDLPYDHKDIVEGALQVSHLESEEELQELPEFAGPTEFGVGVLAVIISINQESSDTYQPFPPYLDMTAGMWRERGDYEGSEGLIVPTHELMVIQFSKPVHFNAKSKHRRHFRQIRSGSKPWAKFLFYYRSHSAITAAGCVEQASDLSQALESDGAPQHVQKPMEGVKTTEDIQADTAPKAVMKNPKLGGYNLFDDQAAPLQSSQNSMDYSEEADGEESATRSFRNSPIFVNDDDNEEEIGTSSHPTAKSLKQRVDDLLHASAGSHIRGFESAFLASAAAKSRSAGSPVPPPLTSAQRSLVSPVPTSSGPLKRTSDSPTAPMAGYHHHSVEAPVISPAGFVQPGLDAPIPPTAAILTTTSGSHKRTIEDSPNTPLSDAPNKKPRVSDRKAALLAEIEEMKRKKTAEAEQLAQSQEIFQAEQRKLEEMETDELEELERMKAELSAENQELGRANAEVRERIMEVREMQREYQQ